MRCHSITDKADADMTAHVHQPPPDAVSLRARCGRDPRTKVASRMPLPSYGKLRLTVTCRSRQAVTHRWMPRIARTAQAITPEGSAQRAQLNNRRSQSTSRIA